MEPKIISTILVVLLSFSFVITTINITGVIAFPNTTTNTQNALNDLLKGVDFKEPQKTANSMPTNPFDLNPQPNMAPSGNWGSSSHEFIMGISDTWQSYAKVEQFALSHDAKVVDKIEMGNRIEAVVVNVSSGSAPSFVQDAKTFGLSTYVESRGVYQTLMTPNDPYWSQQWGPQKIRAQYSWNITTGNKTRVLVAVVDTGIDYSHPDLSANYVPLGYDWVNNDSDPKDDNGHGTHVAGIIAAVTNNGVGIAGLAQVRIMAEKGLDYGGSGYYDVLARAIIHATDMNASIINMSWGGSSPSSVIEDALKYAYAHGVLLVAAAGNAASSAKLYPAAYDEVVAVTATDPNDLPAYFTSYGDWVELAAPGYHIYSTLPTYHVTLNDMGYASNYDYLSGTSMASPHVAGVAALVLSQFPNMSRDVLRLHLRDTADDLGNPGFDIYYGYGRVNAYKALTQPLPPHDIVIASLEQPPYIEPNTEGTVNATIINYGNNNENVTVELLINGTLEQSSQITSFLSGASARVSFSWTPTTVGNYNVTVYVPPVAGEINVKNNVIQRSLFVGVPLRVFVLRSAGTAETTDTWDALNSNWRNFGSRLIYIDYMTLNKDNISYADLNATKADVLILSCSFMWEYTDAEVQAITQYVHEGHGFIATAGTFFYGVPNNNKFAPLFGLNQSIYYDETQTDLLNITEPSHPLFAGMPNPYTMPLVGTAIPQDGGWSSNELAGGSYKAIGYYDESAIVTYQGLVYISPWLEAIPAYYNFNLQLLYNAITWTQFVRPQHELVTSLQVPPFLAPSSTVIVNATVRNNGAQNESNVDFQLSVFDMTNNATRYVDHPAPFTLLSGNSFTLSYSWNPGLVLGLFNITAYVSPVLGEDNVVDNKATTFVNVIPKLINPQEGTWALYKLYTVENSTGKLLPYGDFQFNYYKHISSYQMNVTEWEVIRGMGNLSGYTIVNEFTRYDEGGNIWQGLWFPGMIETGIGIGNLVNVLGGPALVVGSESLVVGSKVVDCWKLVQQSGSGTFTYWYDKGTGLWIKLDETAYTPSGFQRVILIFDSSNIPVGFSPQHELQVTLNAPSLMKLGNPLTINATVSNFGQQNETNVQLNLQINGTIVNSTILTTLAVNTSGKVSYQWMPTISGSYNVTAYALPVLGETVTSDNYVTIIVKVFAIRGFVLFDLSHSNDSPGTYSTWISSLVAHGFVVDTLYTYPINSSTLAGYDAFISIQARSAYGPPELAAIRQFVANGGGLLVVGDDNPSIYTTLTGFADIAWTGQSAPSGNTSRIFHPHEVTNGVNTVYLTAPIATLVLSGGAQWLVNDTLGGVMVAANDYQHGRVLGFTDEDSLADYGLNLNRTDNLKLAINMITWLAQKDTVPPVLSIIAPENGTLIGPNPVVLEWTASDNESGIDYYTIYRNGQFITNTTATTYPLSGFVEGANNVTIVALDMAENHASKTAIFYVDTTPPTLQILAPSNNTYVGKTVAINVSGSDAHFSHMDLRVDGEPVNSFNSSGEFTYLWDTSTKPDGAFTITLIGYDLVGNSASISETVTVDNTAPFVDLTSPLNQTVIETTAVKLEWFAADGGSGIDHFSVYLNGELFANTLTQSIDLANLPGGMNNATVVAYDKLGNHASDSHAIIVSTVVPVVEILSPANASYVRGDITIAFIAQDVALKNATITIGDALSYNVKGANSVMFNTTELTDGIYPVKLIAYDMVGNRAETSVIITIDNHDPSAQILSPVDGAFTRGSVDIAISYNDTNFKEAILAIDGTTKVMLTSNPLNPVYTWNTTSADDGMHAITLTVTDLAGNSVTAEMHVYIDDTLPTAEVRSPADSAYVNGTQDVTVSGSDTNLANMSLRIDNGAILQSWNASGPHTYHWDTMGAAEGLHAITLTVTDKAGNNVTASIFVTVHNTPPTVSISSPSPAATVSGTVNINYAATDASSLKLYIDNAEVTLSTSQNYHTWDTTQVIDGNHTIRIVATNIIGAQKEASISVIVANAPPTYLTYLGYASAAILGLAVGAVALWAFKRKPVPTSPVA